VTRWLRAAVFAALSIPAAVAAQDPAPDSSRPVRAIEIRRFNVFTPAEAKHFLPRLANSLHATTRAPVIRRELLFRAGAPYDSARVAETARNLRGLGVFQSVAIDSIRTDSGLVLRVSTSDGWSTRPDFRFKSTGSSVVYTLSMDELNFLGTATFLGLRYRKTPDRSTVTASFRQARLFAGNVGLGLAYEDRSDGRSGFVSLSRPYFSLSGRSTWYASMESRRERILQFYDGADVARDTLERRYSLGYATAGWALRAGVRGYVRVGFIGQLRRDDYAAESRVDTLGQTLSGAAGAYLQWRVARYLVTSGLEGFSRQEDIDVSTVAGFGLMATPRGFGYAEDGVVPYVNAHTGFGRPDGFVLLNGTASGRFTPSGLDSGSVHLAGTAFLLPVRGQLATLHAAAGWQDRPAPGANFDLGLGVGPRAFRQHAFTGDRAFFTSGEYRWTATDDFLKLTAIGIAGFVDYGGAWYHGSPMRTGWDFGLGLRLGFTRATDIATTRVDLAYRVGNDRQRGGLVLVVGKGFAFSSNGRLDQ
jgi:hypothetical protein